MSESTGIGLSCNRCGLKQLTQTWSGMCPACYRAVFGDAFIGGTVITTPQHVNITDPFPTALLRERDRYRDALRDIKQTLDASDDTAEAFDDISRIVVAALPSGADPEGK